MKQFLKNKYLGLVLKSLRHPLVKNELRNQSDLWRANTPSLQNLSAPYDDLGRASDQPDHQSLPAVFITGRFRSGSTMLWNVFRSMDGVKAYYEPFNERRWFDPAARGDQVDSSHRGVDDYWKEYEGLEHLSQYFRPEWSFEGLLMGAENQNPAMRRYLSELIAHAQGLPVLQFNRVDFRLAWLKSNFPRVPIVHLYRNPRDQWLSCLKSTKRDHADQVNPFDDGFYTAQWAQELSHSYPVLAEPEAQAPYRRFYLLWKLSWLHGDLYADSSVAYEALIEHPKESLSRMFDTLRLKPREELDALAQLIGKPRENRSMPHPPEWFAHEESVCETLLEQALTAAPATNAS